MTTRTLVADRADSGLAGITTALMAGLALLFIAGVSQASIMHDAAHDQRHAIGFPCH